MKFTRIILILLLVDLTSCHKLVDIPEPVDTITTPETFSTTANATSAIVGIYAMLNWNPYVGSNISQYAGLSSDELVNFDPVNYPILTEFQTNTLDINLASSTCGDYFWTPLYSAIYKANASIEGLSASKALTTSVKNQLTGEAKFLRAYCYFYLVNLFGDVPLVTSTAWENNRTLSRATSVNVYEQIIADLKDAEGLLTEDYDFSKGERTRATKWAAAALLARAYLYTGEWVDAEKASSVVIDSSNGLYSLAQDLNTTFLMNSSEAIWQLAVADQFPYSTDEANQFVPPDESTSPHYYLSAQFIASIEPGDLRKADWVDSTNLDDGTGTIVTYYYPYKYKVRQQDQPGSVTEYVMALRFAEQYLIRAEARAHNNDFTGATSDLNVIRLRALLNPLPDGLSQSQVLDAVAQERRVELFSEWGHRWLDLKRANQADAVLSLIKPLWQGYQKLYPIPSTELQTDPNLKQNIGY